MSRVTRRTYGLAVATLAAALLLPSAARAQNLEVVQHPKYPPPAHEKQRPAVEKNLRTFDVLDFDVFSNQKWDRLGESHAADIVVTWPDGHETKGIEKHIEDLKALFVYAPDIQIKTHPIRFGSGTFTTATGIMTGTFTKPMPIGNGQVIQPTAERFALPMATIGHWVNGKMDHEWLFWDSQEFMKQLGLAK
ncbi:MAG: SnoaL-like domain-containing protein [Gemmatimonadaceae bacterium]|nr:SnoaL-like domain-containing protein [Gemmatimonadaceae bacterium]